MNLAYLIIVRSWINLSLTIKTLVCTTVQANHLIRLIKNIANIKGIL